MKRGWIALLAGLSAGALLVCCVAGLVLSFGLVSLPTAGVTQPPVAALTQPPPVPTVPLASPVIVATPTTAPPTERTVSVTALAYNAARAEGSTQRAQVIIRPKSDSIVRVGFLERTAVGIGATWRSAAWTATTAAALMLGVDLSAYDIAFDTGAELIDGPSASGLMTVAVLAGLLGDDVRADAAMTGTINPDGTIGPVGGVPQKIEGAARDGKKLVVVPIVNRNSVDLKSKKTVDVVEWGRNLGVEVRPVSTVYEAYEILTGKKLPRPAGAPRAALSSRATAQFTAATNVLLARYNQEMQRYNALPENIRQGRAESVSSATQSAQTCSKYLAQGLPEIAFQHGFEALSAFVALNASARLDQLYLQGDYPGMVAQAQAAEKALPLNAALDRLKAQTPRTATDAIALMDAYSDQAAAFALTAEGDLLLIGVAKAMPTGKPSEEWLNTLYRANGDFANASVYLELVDQLLTTYIGFGQSSAPSEARAAVMAETLHRAAEANLAYFESILDDNARTLNVDAAKLRGVVFSRDGDYRNAKFSLVGIPFAAQR
ncbi:MAG: S16 family serine protease, partial [Chloroflexota bacterium]